MSCFSPPPFQNRASPFQLVTQIIQLYIAAAWRPPSGEGLTPQVCLETSKREGRFTVGFGVGNIWSGLRPPFIPISDNLPENICLVLIIMSIMILEVV